MSAAAVTFATRSHARRPVIQLGSGALWPQLKPLTTQLPPVDKFTAELLPSWLSEHALDVSQLMQVPLEFTAIPAIAALAGCTNRRAIMQPKALDSTWRVVPNLFAAIVGKPGLLKSPSIAEMTKPLAQIEARYQLENSAALAEYVASKKSRRSKRGAKTKESNVELDEAEPTEPTPKRIVVNDSTFEKLHEINCDNPAGLFVQLDELSGWLETMERSGREGERAYFCSSWMGDKPHTIDRILRGSLHCPACCLSLLGGIQPRMLESFIAGDRGGVPLNDDGLLARIQLLVWPDVSPAFKYVDRVPHAKAAQRFERVCLAVATLDPTNPVQFKFSHDAQALFEQWFTNLQMRLRSDELTPDLATHLSKYNSLMPSLALLFELGDIAAKHAQRSLQGWTLGGFGGFGGRGYTCVSLANAQLAIDWCTYLESHAKRVYGCAGSPELHSARRLGERISQRSIPSVFTARDVEKKDWAELNKPEKVKAACAALVRAGWIREVKQKGNPKGGRPSLKFEVNPKVYRA